MNSIAIKRLSLFLACGLFAGASSAAEVLVTMAPGKAGTSFALDLANEGGVVGFNFKIALPGLGNEKAANLRSCTAELPKGWSGSCAAHKGGVFVFATQDSMVPTTPGVLSIGTISLSGYKVAKGAKVTVEELFVSDPKGMPIATQSKINAE